MAPVLSAWTVKLPACSLPPQPHTDDFGMEIAELLMAPETEEKTHSLLKSILAGKNMWDGITFKHTAQNLKAIANQLGMSIQQASSFYYVRDAFLRLKDGSIACAAESGVLEKAMEGVHSSNLYLDKTATTRTRNQLFNHWSGFAAHYVSPMQKDRELLFPKAYRRLPNSYLEGGNVLRLSNGREEQVVLVGEDHRLQTLMLLELEGRNWEALGVEAALADSFHERIQDVAARLTAEEIWCSAEEMYSLGLLLHKGKSGLLAADQQLNLLLAKFFLPGKGGTIISEEERGWLRELAIASGMLGDFQLNAAELERVRSSVAEYLVKQEIVHALMACDLQVAKQHLHFIAQANYHLDAFMAPAPQRAVFMVNYALLAELLTVIKAAQVALELSEGDVMLLDGYLAAAQKFDRELGGLLALTRRQLEAAGLTVIPLPAHLLYEPSDMYVHFPMPSEGLCINFINALTGYSSALKAPYYITHGLHAGEQVGGLCMELFASCLRQYMPSVAVYFIGYDPDHPEDFSEGLDFWNRLETQSGIHCVTFPLKCF